MMETPLSKLRKLQRKYKCPVFIAGDIFNRWNAPAELINFMMEQLPEQCYGIPGQHDLPFHRYTDIRKSAYWTLVQAGRIQDLKPGEPTWVATWDYKMFLVYAFPWGHKITPLVKPEREITIVDNPVKIIHLALVHSYIHLGKYSYPNAPEEQNLYKMLPALKGYNLCIFGDNHKGFRWSGGKHPTIINCGGFMQWKSDEWLYQPSIWLIMKDGTIKREVLIDKMAAQWNEAVRKVNKIEASLDAEDFLDSLTHLGEASINFEEALRRAANSEEVRDPVRRIVLEMLERNNG